MKTKLRFTSSRINDEDDDLRVLPNPLKPYVSNAKIHNLYTIEDVSSHNTENDAWTIIREEVYDITQYINKHPGGLLILNHVGGDSTESFNLYGHGKVAQDILKKFKIGNLVSLKKPDKMKDLNISSFFKDDVVSPQTLTFHGKIKTSSDFSKFKKYVARENKKDHFIQFLLDVDNFVKKKDEFSDDVVWNMLQEVFFEYFTPSSEKFLDIPLNSISDCMTKFYEKNVNLFKKPEQEVAAIVVNEMYPKFQESTKKKRKSLSLSDLGFFGKSREIKSNSAMTPRSIVGSKIASGSFEFDGSIIFLSDENEQQELDLEGETDDVEVLVDSLTKSDSILEDEIKKHPSFTRMQSFYPDTLSPAPYLKEFEDEEIEKKSKQEIFFDAVSNGDFETFSTFLDDNEIDFFQKCEQKTLLHIAVIANSFQICEALINKGINVNAEDNLYRSPLHLACSSGNNDIALLLLGNQSKVNVRDHYGYTPLMLSLKQHFFELADNLILFNADINFKRDNGLTALHEAAQRGDVDIYSWLIKRDELKINARDQLGSNPFIRSLEKANVSFIEKLIHHKGMDLFCSDVNGRNLFHMIARNQRTDVLKKFLQFDDEKLSSFKNLITANDKNLGYTPLHYAVKFATSETVKLLVILIHKLNEDDTKDDSRGESPHDLCCKLLNEAFDQFIDIDQEIIFSEEMIDRQIVQKIEMKKFLNAKEKKKKKGK
eukprot:gene8708-654_t